MATLSIVTTVYDRAECLATCLRSTTALNFRDWEQHIIADCPPDDAFRALEQVVARANDQRITLHRLPARANDFGITPASHGLKQARGRFLAFLDDDNAFVPSHFDGLLPWLEGDPNLGFVYGACCYKSDRLLAYEVPALAHIDLGQVVFRRELFQQHLNDTLPFAGYEWDWQLISRLLEANVRWRFVNQPTFLFGVERFRPFEAEAALVVARAGLSGARAELQAHSERISALERRVSERDLDLEAAKTRLVEIQQQRDADAERARTDRARAAAIESELRGMTQNQALQLAASRAETAAEKGRSADLDARLFHAQHDARALRSSLSWRLTAPLRGALDRLLLRAKNP